VLSHCRLEKGKGPGGEFVCFEEGELIFGQFGSGFGLQLSKTMSVILHGTYLVRWLTGSLHHLTPSW
jgi:hypothetical protein